MKTNLLAKIPTGSPAADIIKIIGMIAASILIDKMSDLIKEMSEDSPFVDVKFKEGR